MFSAFPQRAYMIMSWVMIHASRVGPVIPLRASVEDSFTPSSEMRIGTIIGFGQSATYAAIVSS